MINDGQTPPPPLVADPSKIYRFGKNKSLWLIASDDFVCGVIGDWKTGNQKTWIIRYPQKTEGTE